MNKFLSELKYITTVDNSHEEDNDAFEYYSEPVSDKFLGVAATAAVMAILIMSLF